MEYGDITSHFCHKQLFYRLYKLYKPFPNLMNLTLHLKTAKMRASIVAQHAKPPPTTWRSQTTLVQVLAASLLTQLPAKGL